MDEIGRCAGGGEGGGDLASHMPGFAHAADDDAALGGQDHADRMAEIAVQRLRKARKSLGRHGQHPASGREIARGCFARNGMQGGLGARHTTLCFKKESCRPAYLIMDYGGVKRISCQVSPETG